MAASILQAFGLLKEAKIRLISDGELKIDHKPLKEDNTISSCNPASEIRKLENSLVEEEFLDMKDENLSDSMEFDFENYSDNSTPLLALAKPYTSSKRKQKVILTSDNDNEDWEPKKLSKCETNLSDYEPKNEKMYRTHRLSESDLELYKTFHLPKSLDDYKSLARIDKGFAGKSKEANINDPKLMIQCDQCEKKFSVRSSLNQHVIKHHNEHLECPFCLYSYHLEDSEEFKMHIFMHICGKVAIKTKNSATTICICCGDLSNSKHLEQSGPFHNDECSQCSQKMSSYQEYCKHVKKEHFGVWKYRCGHCEGLFDKNKDLLEHSESAHQKQTSTKRTKGSSVLKKYPGVCNVCGCNSNYIERHMKYNHNTDPVQCSYCHKMFSNRDKLIPHEKIHIQQPCSVCGAMVPMTKLSYHMKRKHTPNEDLPYKCEVCSKGFICHFKRDEHINVHTGAKPFKCKYCPSAYASFGTLRMHERSHLGIKRKPKKS